MKTSMRRSWRIGIIVSGWLYATLKMDEWKFRGLDSKVGNKNTIPPVSRGVGNDMHTTRSTPRISGHSGPMNWGGMRAGGGGGAHNKSTRGFGGFALRCTYASLHVDTEEGLAGA